jgi:hypothetical protein
LVAVGIDDSSAGAWTSIDGNGWTRSNPTNLGGEGKLEMYGVAAFNNMFVAVGYETGNGLDAEVWLSRDGSSWERVPHTETFGGAGDQWMNRVATAGPGLVGVGVDGQNPGVWTSSDGIAWTQAPDAFPGGGSMRGVTKWGRLIVTVGFIRPEGAPLDPAAWYADTTGGALSWHQGTVPTAAGDQKMAAAVGFGDGLIAVGFSGSDAAVWQSNDGRTWRVVRQAAFRGSGNQEMFDVTNVAGIGLVAVGSDDDKGALWTSRDGKSWTRQLVGGKLIHSLVVQDGRLVLGGQTGGDAAVWTMEVVS